MSQEFEAFFRSRSLLPLVDAMAQKYGKLPHEILMDCTVFEFMFDSAVFYAAQEMSTPEAGTPKGDKQDETWTKLGIGRTVISKEEADSG